MITTSRLALRPPRIEDAEAMFASYASDALATARRTILGEDGRLSPAGPAAIIHGMLILLFVANADALLKLVPAPPTTVVSATARCSNDTDAGVAKFEEANKKYEEELTKRAEAFAAKAASAAPPSGAEAQLLAPAPDEIQQTMATQQAIEAVRTSIAAFETERGAAVEAARKKSTCKEGNSACLPAWLKQLRQTQTDALEKHARANLTLWNAARAAIEKSAKLMAPRLAKLAASKSAIAQNVADTMPAQTAEGAKQLASLSTQSCTAMLRFEE